MSSVHSRQLSGDEVDLAVWCRRGASEPPAGPYDRSFEQQRIDQTLAVIIRMMMTMIILMMLMAEAMKSLAASAASQAALAAKPPPAPTLKITKRRHRRQWRDGQCFEGTGAAACRTSLGAVSVGAHRHGRLGGLQRRPHVRRTVAKT